MKPLPLRSRIACCGAVLFGFPFLMGADDRGCRPGGTIPVGSGATEGGPGEVVGCVSQQGAHCGGNTAQPCTCAPGLACTPGDSGLPFGDVGGACEPPHDSGCVDTVLCVVGDVFDPVLCRCVAASSEGGGADGGSCVSQQGGHCGGNTTRPCTCAPGLACTPGDSGLPFGDVGGTCEPAHDAGCMAAPIDAGACQSAADCHGPLPFVCMACSDGATDCAHWICANGQCVDPPFCE
jgi:hypothetical protein